MNGREEMDTVVVPGNAIERIYECQKYIVLQMWPQFFPLFRSLQQFIDKTGDDKKRPSDEEFKIAFTTLKSNAVDAILTHIENAKNFDEYKKWIINLSDAIPDRRMLWNILHTEVNTPLKVNPDFAREIQRELFTSDMVFEYSLESLLCSSLCDLATITKTSQVIDLFYILAGLIRACEIPDTMEIKNPRFVEFCNRLLCHYAGLPGFDPYRFNWLIDNFSKNLHLTQVALNSMINVAILTCSNANSPEELLTRMSIISTSPATQKIKMIGELINDAFQQVLQRKMNFLSKYILSGTANEEWSSATPGPSESARAWALYMNNLAEKIKKTPEIPGVLVTEMVGMSLSFFVGFYGEIDPTVEAAPRVMQDCVLIVSTAQKLYNGEIPDAHVLQNAWFLLFCGAIAASTEISDTFPEVLSPPKPQEFLLGIPLKKYSFANPNEALKMIASKFESEKENYPNMVSILRANM